MSAFERPAWGLPSRGKLDTLIITGRRFKMAGSETTRPVNGSTFAGKFVGPYCTSACAVVTVGIVIAVALGRAGVVAITVALGRAGVVAITVAVWVAVAVPVAWVGVLAETVWQAVRTILKTRAIAAKSAATLNFFMFSPCVPYKQSPIEPICNFESCQLQATGNPAAIRDLRNYLNCSPSGSLCPFGSFAPFLFLCGYIISTPPNLARCGV